MDPKVFAMIFLGVYLTITLIAGMLFGRKSRDAKSWQFGADGLGVFSIVAVLLGIRVGATTTVGMVEYIYTMGIVGYWFILSQSIGSAISGLTIGRLFYRTRMMTLPAFLLHRFSKRIVVLAILADLTIGLALNGLQVLGVGLIIKAITGLSFQWGIVMASVLGWTYLTFGGLAATAATNAVHLIVCAAGVFSGFCVLGARVMPYTQAVHVVREATPEKLNLFNPWVFVASWCVVQVAMSLISNTMLSPLASARSEKQVVGANLLTGLLYGLFGILITVFGIYALAFFGPKYTELTGAAFPAKDGFPIIAMMMGAEGGAGLFLGTMMMAGVIGAILSTMAPVAWAISTLLARDVFKRFIRPDASAREELFATRIFSTVYWLIPGLFALFVEGKMLQTLLFMLMLPVGVVFPSVLCWYWDKVNEQSAFWCMLASFATGCGHFVIKNTHPEWLHPLGPWFGSDIGMILTASGIVFFLFVFLGEPATEKQLDVTRRARENRPPLDSAPGEHAL